MKYQVHISTNETFYAVSEFYTEKEALDCMDELDVDHLSSDNRFLKVQPIDSNRHKFVNKSQITEVSVEEVPDSEEEGFNATTEEV